jgi:hypothetical protein
MVQSIVRSVGCIFHYWVDVTDLRNREIQTRNRRRMSVLQVVHETGKGRVNLQKVKETTSWDPWRTRNSGWWTENVSKQSVTGELGRLPNEPRLLKNHHRHVQEGLGLITVACILKLKLVPPSLPRSSYVPSFVWFRLLKINKRNPCKCSNLCPCRCRLATILASKTRDVIVRVVCCLWPVHSRTQICNWGTTRLQ